MQGIPVPAKHRVSRGEKVGQLNAEGLLIQFLAVRHIRNLEPAHVAAGLVDVVREVEGAVADVIRREGVPHWQLAARRHRGTAHAWGVVVAAHPLVGLEGGGAGVPDRIVLVGSVADARDRIEEAAVPVRAGREEADQERARRHDASRARRPLLSCVRFYEYFLATVLARKFHGVLRFGACFRADILPLQRAWATRRGRGKSGRRERICQVASAKPETLSAVDFHLRKSHTLRCGPFSLDKLAEGNGDHDDE